MALNFPDNPSNGDTYVAENGVEYTYNASIDAWTGSSAAGDNYWAEDASGNIYPVSDTADVYVGGTSTSAPVVIDASGYIQVGSPDTTSDYGLLSYISSDRTDRAAVYARNNTTGGLIWLGYDGTGAVTTQISAAGVITAETFNLGALDPLPD